MNAVCKVCGTPLTPYEDKMCDACFERIREEKEEAKADREISKTEEIFGSEGAYRYYKEGRDYGY